MDSCMSRCFSFRFLLGGVRFPPAAMPWPIFFSTGVIFEEHSQTLFICVMVLGGTELRTPPAPPHLLRGPFTYCKLPVTSHPARLSYDIKVFFSWSGRAKKKSVVGVSGGGKSVKGQWNSKLHLWKLCQRVVWPDGLSLDICLLFCSIVYLLVFCCCICLPTHLLVFHLVHLGVYLSTFLFIWVSTCLPTFLPTCLFVPHLSTCLSGCLSLCLLVYFLASYNQITGTWLLEI